jgi:hypothetical protein
MESIQRTGLYGAGFLCLILAILKLTVETHWSWSRVLLPVWTVLGHNLLYIGLGFIWLSFADDGITEEEIVIRQSNRTYCYQLTALLSFAMFADNVLRRIEGAGQMERLGLTSGRWELIIVFGVLSVALHVLFWSEVVPPVRHRSRGH